MEMQSYCQKVYIKKQYNLLAPKTRIYSALFMGRYYVESAWQTYSSSKRSSLFSATD